MNKKILSIKDKIIEKLTPLFKIVCILLSVYFILNILFLDNYSLLNYVRVKNRYDQMKASHEKIIQTNKELETEIEKLSSDPFYIETIARRDYRMVKKGESVYIFRQ